MKRCCGQSFGGRWHAWNDGHDGQTACPVSREQHRACGWQRGCSLHSVALRCRVRASAAPSVPGLTTTSVSAPVVPTYVGAVSQLYQCLLRVSYAHLRAHPSFCVPSCLSICMSDCVECALHVTAYVISTRTIDDPTPEARGLPRGGVEMFHASAAGLTPMTMPQAPRTWAAAGACAGL